MSREVDYTWRLAEVMARHGMHNTTELVPLLHDRGITLSASQVYRLVTGRPERVSLKVLAACCDIFGCSLEDLITTTAADKRRRRTTNAQVVDLNKAMRPRRARVLRDDD